jgi:hypothetical protein
MIETCNEIRVLSARVRGLGRTSLYRFLKTSDKQSTAAVGA